MFVKGLRLCLGGSSGMRKTSERHSFYFFAYLTTCGSPRLFLRCLDGHIEKSSLRGLQLASYMQKKGRSDLTPHGTLG